MKMIRIVLVDDQPILLDGLRAILETDANLRVTGMARDGEEAIRLADTLQPDVMLMDIRMRGIGGVEATRKIKIAHPGIAVLMLTTFDDREYIVDALRFGACGYLLKDIDGERLIRSVKDAAAGDTILPSRIAGKLVEQLVDPVEQSRKVIREKLDLSPREAEIALMLADGFTNRQIATSLFLSDGTVKNYVSSLYRKLEVEDRSRAILRLREHLAAATS
jgi:DNA-binding NarL/FixJ family response regulator